MVQGENTTVVEYDIENGRKTTAAHLELRPLIAFRDYHSLTHENGTIDGRVEVWPGLAGVSPYPGLPELYLAHDARELEITGHWYRNFEYDAERERGLDFTEDLFNPCVLSFDLNSQAQATVVASTERRNAALASEYRQADALRRRNIALRSPVEDGFVKSLTVAADQFVVSRGDEKTVIAGYHWFSDWGRDTMIALPGLTLPTHRYDVARSILRTFARHVDRGMLPNRFPDADETPEYNTVDATLWFFEAVRAFLAYTGDLEFVRNDLFGVLTDIISWHLRGTRFGIKVDSSGLLNSERMKQIVGVVEQHLLTPYGLRTLAPSDPQYRGRYFGDPVSRDGAYHQGTVWPWLMGPFITAYIKVNGGTESTRRQAESWLVSLRDHLADAGLGQISEIFDGDPSHCPVGCIAQAWSVAEILRATVEDIYGIRPETKTLATAATQIRFTGDVSRRRAAT